MSGAGKVDMRASRRAFLLTKAAQATAAALAEATPAQPVQAQDRRLGWWSGFPWSQRKQPTPN